MLLELFETYCDLWVRWVIAFMNLDVADVGENVRDDFIDVFIKIIGIDGLNVFDVSNGGIYVDELMVKVCELKFKEENDCLCTVRVNMNKYAEVS